MDPLAQTGDAAFQDTQPSLVALVAKPGAAGYREAWETFFRGYWPPLYSWLRRTGSTREQALDVLQDFFIRGLEGKFLSHFDAERGRFRTFLLTCLANDRKKALRRDRSRPDRRAPQFLSPADEQALADPRAGDPDAEFEAEWIRLVGGRARKSLEERLARLSDRISTRLLAEWVLADERPSGAALAKELGISSGDLYTRATRLRQAFATEVEKQVRLYSDEVAADRDRVLAAMLERRPKGT